MSSAASIGSLSAAALGLVEVQLLRAAMNTPAPGVAAAAQSTPAAYSSISNSASGHCNPINTVVYKPNPSPWLPFSAASYSPINNKTEPTPFCDTDAPVPAPVSKKSASPFQPPWKTLPWPKPRPIFVGGPTVIIRDVPIDRVGQMLDLFV